MSNLPNQPVPSPDSGAPESKHAALLARRRLLRGGLSVAPVLMASAPRSVMAGGPGACVPASSFASINASRPDLLFTCSGRTPGYWKQPQWFGQWPAPSCVPNGNNATKFDLVFGAVGGYPGKTLLDVLELPGNSMGRDALARHIVAALLNAKTGKTPSNVLSEGAVKAVWAEFVRRGYYEPTAGIKWYPDYSVPNGIGGITPWLKSTMPV
jgi:hypothetical protein